MTTFQPFSVRSDEGSVYEDTKMTFKAPYSKDRLESFHGRLYDSTQKNPGNSSSLSSFCGIKTISGKTSHVRVPSTQSEQRTRQNKKKEIMDQIDRMIESNIGEFDSVPECGKEPDLEVDCGQWLLKNAAFELETIEKLVFMPPPFRRFGEITNLKKGPAFEKVEDITIPEPLVDLF